MNAKFLILLGLLGLAAGTRVQEQARAAAWMKAHEFLATHGTDPDDGDLAELAKTDPNSYAIVKALLAKQKMGLLNLNRAHSSDAAAASSSAESDSSASSASAETSSFSSGGGSGNWLSWKPRDDSAIVGNVLGQVAALRGAAPQAAAPVEQPQPEPAEAPVEQQDQEQPAPQPAAPAQQGLISQEQQTSKSTSEVVTDADSNIDLSFGAYKQAATEETKSTFDKDAAVATQGLGRIEAESRSMDEDSNKPFGISMNWSQDGASIDAAVKPHKADNSESNSYLSAYPLSMSQTAEQPQARRNPAEILGAWLQKSKRGGEEHTASAHWWHHIEAPAPVQVEEPTHNSYMDILH